MSMGWKKLLEASDVIAYEKATDAGTVRIEARLKRDRWRIYKTQSRTDKDTTQVKEYIASSLEEAKELVSDLRQEEEFGFHDNLMPLSIDMKRCYKEEYVEKWKFSIDNFSEDNFVIVRFDAEIKLDIVLHDRYNILERELLNKLIEVLGLRDMSDKICYDFFYFRKHSAKRRVYQQPDEEELIAQLEFSIDSNAGEMVDSD